MGIFTGQMVYREQIQKKYGEPMLSELDNIYASFSTALKDVIKTQQSNVSDTIITTITNNVLNQIGTGSKYYDLSISEVTVENTTTETAVYTKTIAGGTLSSGKLLKINLQGLWERFLTGSTNATGCNLAVKVTFGGTVVISGNIATGLGRVDDQKRPHTLEIWVSEVETNTQRWLIYSNFGSGAIASATWYTAPYGLATSAWMSSTAQDTSADQVLAILITHSQQDNTLKYVKQSVLVESVNASASTTPTVPATAGGTGYSSFAVGDILYADTTTSLAKQNVGSAGQILRSNGTNPAYSTLTIPDTVAVSTLLYASSANVLAALATANSGILVTSGTGVPSISSTLPTAVQDNITRLGNSVITGSGALTFTPAAGSNFNVVLSTTGDFVVNTNQLYVDTSAGDVGIGTATPSQELDLIGNLELETTTSSGTGVIYKGASPFLHNFNAASSDGLNTFIGIGAGNFTMSPAGGIVTLASYNTVIGDGSFPVNTTGYYNTVIGAQALQNNTTGYSNTGVGLHALQNNTTGFRNSGIGTAALALNTTGIYNTADGFNALYQNTTGGENTAFGALAATSNTSGARNTVVGVDALSNNTTGVRNTVMGMQALFDLNITAADGTSGNHVAIGYNTGRGVTTGTNNTIIGANVTGLSATLSNNIIIADGAGNQRVRILNTGYTGIGTTAPQVKFHVTGNSATAWGAGTFVADVAAVIGNTNTTDNNFSELRFTTYDAIGDTFTAGGRIGTIFTSHANAAVSGELFFATNNAGTFGERIRLASAGVGIGTTAFPSAGTSGLVFGDGTTLSGMGTNTAGLYADNVGTTVEMFVIDELGASTQISPHGFKLFEPDDIEPYPWSYYSKNEYLGIEINVDICKLARLVQNLTGQQVIYHNNIGGTRDWVDHQEYNMRRQMESYERWEVTEPGDGQAKPPAPSLPQLKQPPLWLKKRLSARGLLNVEKAKALATALTAWKQERHL